jgi:hypothetical protein
MKFLFVATRCHRRIGSFFLPRWKKCLSSVLVHSKSFSVPLIWSAGAWPKKSLHKSLNWPLEWISFQWSSQTFTTLKSSRIWHHSKTMGCSQKQRHSHIASKRLLCIRPNVNFSDMNFNNSQNFVDSADQISDVAGRTWLQMYLTFQRHESGYVDNGRNDYEVLWPIL